MEQWMFHSKGRSRSLGALFLTTWRKEMGIVFPFQWLMLKSQGFFLAVSVCMTFLSPKKTLKANSFTAFKREMSEVTNRNHCLNDVNKLDTQGKRDWRRLQPSIYLLTIGVDCRANLSDCLHFESDAKVESKFKHSLRRIRIGLMVKVGWN